MADGLDAGAVQAPVFEGVKFSVVPSKDLDHDQVCACASTYLGTAELTGVSCSDT